MRGNDEIVVLDDQVSNRRSRKIQLQWLPMVAIIKRNISTKFGAGEEQAFALLVCAYHVNVSILGNAPVNGGPCLAKVMSAIDVWSDVIHLMTIDGRVCCSSIER